MKIVDTLIPKRKLVLSIRTKSKKQGDKIIKNTINNDNKLNQKNTPKETVNKKMTDCQIEIAQKIKKDIKDLYKDGFSIRMITNHYNDLYSTRNRYGEIAKQAISRETVRKILNDEEVSLKFIIGNSNLQI